MKNRRAQPVSFNHLLSTNLGLPLSAPRAEKFSTS
jgi:hypothetical protein